MAIPLYNDSLIRFALYRGNPLVQIGSPMKCFIVPFSLQIGKIFYKMPPMPLGTDSSTATHTVYTDVPTTFEPYIRDYCMIQFSSNGKYDGAYTIVDVKKFDMDIPGLKIINHYEIDVKYMGKKFNTDNNSNDNSGNIIIGVR
jgi:hypothetical protein